MHYTSSKMTKKEDRESKANRQQTHASQSPAISNSNESMCKSKFSYEEDEQIIEYVKQNDVLYNIRHPLYRDKRYKQHLWEKLAKSLNRHNVLQCFSGIDVMRRWMSMRDYFKRILEKRPIKATQSSMTGIDKRNLSMSFLLQHRRKYRKKNAQNFTKFVPEPEPEPPQSVPEQYTESIADSEDPLKLERYLTDEERSEISFRNDERLVYPKTSMVIKRPKVRSPSPSPYTSRRVHEYPGEYQNDMMSLQKRDHIDTFLMAIADSLRNLPSVKLAETKLKITQIVGEAELEIEKARAAAVAVKSLQNFYMSEMDCNDNTNSFTQPENNEAEAEES